MSSDKLQINYERLDIHYWFDDESHTMDAFVQNKCEAEVLKIISEIAIYLNVEIEVVTEPLDDGGLKRTFKIIEKNVKEFPFLTLLFIGLFGFPAKELTTHLIDKIFEDKEYIELQKVNLIKQNRNLDLEYEEKITHLSQRNTIRKKVSNFYEKLETEQKVIKVSYQIFTEAKEEIKDVVVLRNDFQKFIIPTNILEPQDLENQIIEIISPDLKGANYKWKGLYRGEVISFTMKSKEFKKLVKTGKIEFKNGSSINCDIEIYKFLDDDGNEHVRSTDVIGVNEFFEADKPFETPEGKKKRQMKEADKLIMKIDYGKDYE